MPQIYLVHTYFVIPLYPFLYPITIISYVGPPYMTMTTFHLLLRLGLPQGLRHKEGTQNGY